MAVGFVETVLCALFPLLNLVPVALRPSGLCACLSGEDKADIARKIAAATLIQTTYRSYRLGKILDGRIALEVHFA
jgi:hypothetical protein